MFDTRFSRKSSKHFLNILGVSGIAFPLVLPSTAYAQSFPDCRTIASPKPGDVCYTDHPFSQRQRDEGGTKEWPVLIERYGDGWVIENNEIIQEAQLGTGTWPTCSYVSGTGKATIEASASSTLQTLNELKAKLQGKASTISNGVKGEVQGTIESIDREISQVNNIISSIASKGNNEALNCRGTTYVNCYTVNLVVTKKRICEGGSERAGRIRVYRRYLANAGALQANANSLQSTVAQLIQRIDVSPIQPPQPPQPTYCPPGTQWNGSGCIPTQPNSQRGCQQGESPISCVLKNIFMGQPSSDKQSK